MLERNIPNNIKNNKSGKDNTIHLKYQIFSRNYDIESNLRYNSERIEESRQEYLIKNNLINRFKYDRLFYYDKQKNLSNNIKKQKRKKIKLNLKKFDNFHQFIILNKFKSFTESKDFDDLTSNIKTTNNSEFMRTTNLSNNINNQLSLKNIKNHQNYNEIENMKNSDNIILNNNNISYEKYNNLFCNKDNNKTIENSNIISLNNNNIKNQTITNSVKVKKTRNFLNYKFKDIFGNPNDNLYFEGDYCSYRYPNSIISEQIKAKLKYNIINKIQKDFLQNQKEKMTNPIIYLNHYEVLHKKNKNYFEIFGNLIKKYFAYLYSNIENEKHTLNLLKEQKENLKEIIFQITKKINSTKDKKIFYENLLQLLIKIRYNVDSLDKIPNEYLKKYGIMKTERNIKYVSSVVKQRNSTLITELKENLYMKFLRKSAQENNNNSKSKSKIRNRKTTILLNSGVFQSKNTYPPKSPTKRFKSGYKIAPKIPIFNSANELDGKMRGIEYNLKELFKELSSIRLTIQQLKLELNKLKSEYITNKKNKNSFLSFIRTEKEGILNAKKEYEYLLSIKNSLVSSNFNYNDYKLKNNNIDSNKNNLHILNFSEKLISFVLKINIDIEKLLKHDGIYKFLNSYQEKKIIYNSKEYNKTLFCVKILEVIYLYLIDERRKYLSDDKTKKIYRKFQDINDKENRIKKIQEKNNAEYQKRIQREKELELKYNKLIILPIKKDDPFSFNLIKNKTIELNRRNRAKTEKKNKIRIIFENEILF